MIRAIIFDIVGVVLNPKTFHPLAKEYAEFTDMEEKVVHKVFWKYWDLWKVERINENEFFGNLIRDLKLRADKEKLREILYSFPEPDNEIISLIKRLRKKYKVFALTNHTREFFGFLREKYGLDTLFDGIFTSYGMRLAKPDPKIHEVMFREIGMKAGECVFIDDEEEDIETSVKLGMKSILHENAKKTEKELRKIGVNF
jgi:HAD superfamily hydrolase (TIGR01509 family)